MVSSTGWSYRPPGAFLVWNCPHQTLAPLPQAQHRCRPSSSTSTHPSPLPSRRWDHRPELRIVISLGKNNGWALVELVDRLAVAVNEQRIGSE
uniref:Uncharacterized protein n=1 Tax=Setaria viridis TaxID=4556 RepID=A0A4U6TP44_SETVI|nr:hypothetical protein SEVIR_8G261900v2 [Setaria viridis]